MNVKGASIGLLVVFFVFFFGTVMFMAGKNGQHLQYYPGPGGARPHGAPAHAPPGHEPAPAHDGPPRETPAVDGTPDSTPRPDTSVPTPAEASVTATPTP